MARWSGGGLGSTPQGASENMVTCLLYASEGPAQNITALPKKGLGRRKESMFQPHCKYKWFGGWIDATYKPRKF